MLTWSKEAFISALGPSLLHSLWQGALVGAAGIALRPYLKRTTAEVRYGAFCLLLLTLLIAWIGSLGSLYAAESHLDLIPVAQDGNSTLQMMPAPASAPLSDPLSARALRSLAPFLVLIWTLGVSLLALRHLTSFVALRRLWGVGTDACPPEWEARIETLAARMGLRKRILTRLSTRVDVPLTFGILKSYLLLPPSVLMGLAPEQLEALIAHELGHIRLHDTLVNFFQICVETILFYHPVVWWLSAQIRVAREQRCDDLAIRVVGDHALYARALLTMEELRAPIPSLALGATGGNPHMSNHHLIQRIQRVLNINGPERRAPWMAGALALCTAAICVVALWPVRAHGAPARRTDRPAGTRQAPQQKVVSKTEIRINVNGEDIKLTTLDLTPDTYVTVNGQDERFGDLSAEEQQLIRHAVERARNASRDIEITSAGDGDRTRIIVKLDGKKIELTTLDLTPDTHVTVNGQDARFGDLSAEEQQEVRKAVEAARAHSNSVDGRTLVREVRVSQHGSSGADSDNYSATRTATTRMSLQKARQLNVGSDRIKIFGDSLKPDTLVAVNGVKSRFKDLSASRQKQIRAAWTRGDRLSRL